MRGPITPKRHRWYAWVLVALLGAVAAWRIQIPERSGAPWMPTIEIGTPPDDAGAERLDAPAEGAEKGRINAGEGPADASTDAQAPTAPEVSEVPGEHVRVRLLTSAGQPAAGVAVSLRSKRFLRDPRTIASAFTDSAGEAVLHSRDLTQLVTSESGPLALPALSVFPEIPMTEEVAAAVALPLDAEAVYELKLPALGSVTVHVVGPDGEPFLKTCRVGARWVPTVEVGTEVYGGYNRCHDMHRVTSTGRSVYKYVGSDVSMSIHAKADAYGNGGIVDVPITAGPGENQEVTIQLGPMRPLISCQVLAVDGEPVANETLEARVWHGSGSKRPFDYPFQVQTDENGRLEFFHRRELDVEHERRLYLERTAGGRSNRPGPNWSRVDLALPRTLSASQDHDLGTGRLAAPELLQEGFVYDFNGRPASSVRLTFLATTPGEPIDRSQRRGVGMVSTEKDGHFTFRAFERPAGMRVELYGHVKIDGTSTRCYGDHEDLGIGDRAAMFFLKEPPKRNAAPTGTLPVSTSFDADLPGEYFAIQLIRGKRREEAIPMSFLRESPQMLKLPPGPCTLRVFLYGLDHDLIRVEDLEIRAGETLTDTRCLPLDLRGLATRLHVPLQRPNGAPWRGKKLHLRVAAPSIQGKVRTGEDGHLDIAIPSGATGVELSPDGETWTRVETSTQGTVTLAESP